MADASDLPEDLRALARRVAPETRSAMSIFELTQRCEFAAEILAEADETNDPVKADRLRSRAGRVLRAMSPASHEAEMARLTAGLHEARLSQDGRAEYLILEEKRLLDKQHPQPDPDRVAKAAMAMVLDALEADPGLLKSSGGLPPIPPLPGNNIFSRRRKKRK